MTVPFLDAQIVRTGTREGRMESSKLVRCCGNEGRQQLKWFILDLGGEFCSLEVLGNNGGHDETRIAISAVSA